MGQVAHESREGLYMEEIASGAAYEGRKDLGNTQPGDGRRFKGRGLIQLTGRHNYREYSRAVYGDDRAVHSPEMVSRLPDAALAAGWFWDIKGLNVVADTDNVRSVTRIVNGGYHGLADREDTTAQAKRIYAELVQ